MTLTDNGWPQDFTQFQNNDSIRLDNCGQATAMTPPTGVSVSGGMNAGGSLAVPGLTLGTISYSYQVIACDKEGGCSSASAVASTNSGAPILGRVSATIVRMSLSNNTMTVTTAMPHGFFKYALIHIDYFSTKTAAFEGSYIVSGVPSPTTFTFLTSIDSRIAGTPTLDTSGGVVAGFNCNVLSWNPEPNAWKYYIYGRIGGAMTRLGVADPGITSWQDYGSPVMDGMSFPTYVPASPPLTSSNQYLMATISSGAGSGSIQISAPTQNTIGDVMARMGSDAAIIAAAKEASYGTLLIPRGDFQAAGYLDLHEFGPLYVLQGGTLKVADTLEIPGATNWSGWGAYSLAAFQESPTAYIIGLPGSFPTVYLGSNTGGGLELDHIALNTFEANGALLFYSDSGSLLNFNFVTFASEIGPGYMHRHAIFRSGGFDFNFYSCTFTSAQPTLTMADMGTAILPSILFAPRVSDAVPTGGVLFSNSWFVGKSAVELTAEQYSGGEPGAKFVDIQTQNGLLPIFIATNYPAQNTIANRGASFDGYSPADYPTPMTGNWATNILGVSLQNLSNVPTGNRPLLVGNPTVLNSQLGGTASSGPVGGGWFATGGSQVGYLLPTPAAGPSLVVSSGGGIPVGSRSYQIAWTDAFGNSTTLGPSSTVNIVQGMQTVTVSPPSGPASAPAGAVGWQYYRDGALTGPSSTVCGPFSLTASEVDTFSYVNCGDSAPLQPTALSSGEGQNGLETTEIVLTGGGHKTVISGTFTADHSLEVPDVSGTVAVKIANGTVAMPTDSVDSGNCGTVVTAAASAVLPSDAIHYSLSAAPTPGPALKIVNWPTVNNVNFQYCNETAASLTPSATTLNWQVLR